MKKLITATFIGFMAFSFVSVTAYAHSGRTDKNGCHVEKETGKRHCH